MTAVSDLVEVQRRVPPLVLISGPEQVLAERGLAEVLEAVRERTPEVEVIRLHAAAYQPGELMVHASPSLFGGDKAVVVHDLDEATDGDTDGGADHVADQSSGALPLTA